MKAARSMEEFLKNPSAYGMPTFEEFRRNRKKYLNMPTDMVEAIDAGDPILGSRQRYFIEADHKYAVDSLEQAERIALEEGLSLFHDYVVDPQLREDVSGRIYNEVTFRKKAALAKRADW